jgi:hypothetical protein
MVGRISAVSLRDDVTCKPSHTDRGVGGDLFGVFGHVQRGLFDIIDYSVGLVISGTHWQLFIGLPGHCFDLRE